MEPRLGSAQMMEWLKDMADPREFMEGLGPDLSRRPGVRVHPEGQRQPAAGATPVDFASTDSAE